jgi:hypothetical protein
MAWRLNKAVVRGEIDNRTKGVVTGKIWLIGDLTASRKVRVFDIPLEEALAMYKQKEKPPESCRRSPGGISLIWMTSPTRNPIR